MTIETETTAADTSILAAITPKKAKAPKASKPAKVAKAKPAKAAKQKPAAKAKASPKAKKESAMIETVTAPVDPVETFFAEFIASDTRSDQYMRDLLKRVYEAGQNAKRPRAPRAGGPSKASLAADLLRRPEGATTKEILELTKWPAVSVPAIARSAGLTLRQEKDGKVTRYYGS